MSLPASSSTAPVRSTVVTNQEFNLYEAVLQKDVKDFLPELQNLLDTDRDMVLVVEKQLAAHSSKCTKAVRERILNFLTVLEDCNYGKNGPPSSQPLKTVLPAHKVASVGNALVTVPRLLAENKTDEAIQIINANRKGSLASWLGELDKKEYPNGFDKLEIMLADCKYGLLEAKDVAYPDPKEIPKHFKKLMKQSKGNIKVLLTNMNTEKPEKLQNEVETLRIYALASNSTKTRNKIRRIIELYDRVNASGREMAMPLKH